MSTRTACRVYTGQWRMSNSDTDITHRDAKGQVRRAANFTFSGFQVTEQSLVMVFHQANTVPFIEKHPISLPLVKSGLQPVVSLPTNHEHITGIGTPSGTTFDSTAPASCLSLKD